MLRLWPYYPWQAGGSRTIRLTHDQPGKCFIKCQAKCKPPPAAKWLLISGTAYIRMTAATTEHTLSISPSPMLLAIDLLRANIDGMEPEEYEAHVKLVLDTIGALNEYINSPSPKSANALRNALSLVRRLGLHMARLRDLINARKLCARTESDAHSFRASGAHRVARADRIELDTVWPDVPTCPQTRSKPQAGDGLGMVRLRYCLPPPDRAGPGCEQNRAKLGVVSRPDI